MWSKCQPGVPSVGWPGHSNQPLCPQERLFLLGATPVLEGRSQASAPQSVSPSNGTATVVCWWGWTAGGGSCWQGRKALQRRCSLGAHTVLQGEEPPAYFYRFQSAFPQSVLQLTGTPPGTGVSCRLCLNLLETAMGGCEGGCSSPQQPCLHQVPAQMQIWVKRGYLCGRGMALR